ncbi:MAG: hypothetical protein OXC31_28665 [Spirochaetaceae bacterium]|nr:hypothetical protein [Spirochaetaceae bacterium]
MAVRTGGYGYPFEFRVAELSPPGSALAQLQERDHAATSAARRATSRRSRSPTRTGAAP